MTQNRESLRSFSQLSIISHWKTDRIVNNILRIKFIIATSIMKHIIELNHQFFRTIFAPRVDAWWALAYRQGFQSMMTISMTIKYFLNFLSCIFFSVLWLKVEKIIKKFSKPLRAIKREFLHEISRTFKTLKSIPRQRGHPERGYEKQ